MPHLSIVIPCPVFDRSLEDTLVSVLQNRPSQSEVIVVTRGKYDDPYDLAGEVEFVEGAEDASLIQLVNCGIEAASAEIVHLLQPGAQVVEGWTDEVLDHFLHDPAISAVSPAVVRRSGDDRATSLGLGYRPSGVRCEVGKGRKLSAVQDSERTVLGPTLIAGFYRREVLMALGGLDELMGATCADVDLALAMSELGLVSIVEPRSRVVFAGPCEWSESAYGQARNLERLYRRNAPTAGLQRLLHGWVTLLDLVTSFPRPSLLGRLLGRLVGRLESSGQVAQQDRIQRAKEELDAAQDDELPRTFPTDFSQRRTNARHANSSQLRRAA